MDFHSCSKCVWRLLEIFLILLFPSPLYLPLSPSPKPMFAYVSMCAQYCMCRWVCVCVYVCVICVCRSEIGIKSLPQSFSTLFSKQALSLHLEPTIFAELAGWEVYSICLLLFPPTLGSQAHVTVPGFLCEFWGLISDPGACVASLLPIEPNLHSLSLWIILYITEVSFLQVTTSCFPPHGPIVCWDFFFIPSTSQVNIRCCSWTRWLVYLGY